MKDSNGKHFLKKSNLADITKWANPTVKNDAELTVSH